MPNPGTRTTRSSNPFVDADPDGDPSFQKFRSAAGPGSRRLVAEGRSGRQEIPGRTRLPAPSGRTAPTAPHR